MAESIKISELDELVSGSVIGTTKVPVVDGGATKYTQASSIKAYVNSDVVTDAELSTAISGVNLTIGSLTTADISENSSYKYYTDARVTDRLNALSVLSGSTTSLTVTDGANTGTQVDSITFSGAEVTNNGSGDVTVTISTTPTLSVTDGVTNVTSVDSITFDGADVADDGGGNLTVTITPTAEFTLSMGDGINTVTSFNSIILDGATVTDLGEGEVNLSINSTNLTQLNSFTGSIRSEINGIEAFTASFSSSAANRLTSLEAGGISLPDGLVSSSAQIDYNSIQNTPAGALQPPTILQGTNITITSSSFDNTVTINSTGGTDLTTEATYYIVSQSIDNSDSNLILETTYIDSTKNVTFSEFSESVQSRIGTGGGSDAYISNVSFSDNTLTFTGNGIAFNSNVPLSDGIVSSSNQITDFGFTTTYEIDSTYIANRLPSGVISGSTQISNLGFINNSSGVISSSAQIYLVNTISGGFDTSNVAENVNFQYYTDTKVNELLNSLDLISGSYRFLGTISSSAQISDLGFIQNDWLTPLNTYTGSSGGVAIISQSINQRIDNISESISSGNTLPIGVVSGSSQIDYFFVQNIPTFAPGDGILISQSLENAITISGTSAAPAWDSILYKPYNIVSSSVQIDEYHLFSKTGSANTFYYPQTILAELQSNTLTVNGASSLQNIGVGGSSTFTGPVYNVVGELITTPPTASLDFSTGNFFQIQLDDTTATHISASNITSGQIVTVLLQCGTNSTASFSSNILQPFDSFYTASQVGEVDIITFTTFGSDVYLTSVKNNFV